ncbi:hypothetical protein ACHAW5_004880 [Stephanodiscus triporus]|uniref:Uncharacterized protein n=1 Tax=Stephanodiscus triporus TaxID=2934178 RepID=A0ABD3P4A1_9STRA
MEWLSSAKTIPLVCSALKQGYEPLLASGIWEFAWTALDPALPTSSPTPAPTPEPTSSPTAYTGICTYAKTEVTTGAPVPCEYASSADCLCTTVPVSVNPLGYACTKPSQVLTSTDISVELWSSSTTYAADDVVRVGIDRFKCKPYPFTGWCSNPAYAPTSSDSGLWTAAWELEVDKCPLGSP